MFIRNPPAPPEGSGFSAAAVSADGKITAGNDGIQAETALLAEDAALAITAGGGSGSGGPSSSEESYKGLKAGSTLLFTGGSAEIDSGDDCIHSNDTVQITGADANGYAENAAISGGTTLLTVEMTSDLYTSGSAGGMNSGGMNPGGMNPGGMNPGGGRNNAPR